MDHSDTIIALSSILAAITTIAVALRLWSRHLYSKAGFGWDDTFIVISLIFALGSDGLAISWANYSRSKDINNLSPHELKIMQKYFYAGASIMTIAIYVPKNSVLSYYNRVFGFTNPRFRHSVYWLEGINFAGMTAFLLVGLFPCTPITWSIGVPIKCIDIYAASLSAGLFSTVFDVIVLMMPIPLIWALHISMERKVRILSVFIFGYSVVAFSIARTVIVAFDWDTIVSDTAWRGTILFALNLSEAATSITGACVPSLSMLYTELHKQGWIAMLPKNHRRQRL